MTPAANTPQPIYAEHGMGGWPLEPTTFLFTKPQGDLCRAGWIPGHVAEGTVLPNSGDGVRVIVLRSEAERVAA